MDDSEDIKKAFEILKGGELGSSPTCAVVRVYVQPIFQD